MGIINENFMLKSECAKRLYKAVENLPIIDYHCHLSPKMIAENYQFKNPTDLFLGGDHYKWRQMRTAGIDERLITGDGDDYEKFLAFAKMMPELIGNPIYHWTHLELKRYFDIDEPLTEKNCKQVWDKCCQLLAKDEYRAQSLIVRSGVEALCTTDDPADTLEYHEKLRDFSVKVLPTFRPDKLVEIGADTFIPYMKSIGITNYADLVEWIKDRIDYFKLHGCRLADHSLGKIPFAEGNAERVLEKKLDGEDISELEIDVFRTEILKVLAKEYVRAGFTMQIHIGALRNNNRRMFEKLGADAGFDSMNDFLIAEPLSRLLDSFNCSGNLPKIILYTLNPMHNYVLGTMIGNFQGGGAGKMQFGSGWWFNDQRDGMEAQMRALANLGMISKFVGMLTDSRSFVSYPRHEYFRRILCNLIGKWVDEGEYPEDYDALEKIVKNICYYNAKNYFEF